MKLISINVERDRHCKTVVNFLKKEKPDIVCFQEIMEGDLSMYEKLLGMKYFFKPMTKWPELNDYFGIAIFSKKILSTNYEYYVGSEDHIPIFERKDAITERLAINHLIMWITTEDESGEELKIANTHFTWAPNASVTDFQREDIKKLLIILDKKIKEFILVGDTNAPRGKEIFDLLASNYKDNIPIEYKTSIDQKLHRVKGIQAVVDTLFTTPTYKASNVRLVDGVSDHMAVVAKIEKV
jgi:exonuclease III